MSYASEIYIVAGKINVIIFKAPLTQPILARQLTTAEYKNILTSGFTCQNKSTVFKNENQLLFDFSHL
jgi:hypothetical protein